MADRPHILIIDDDIRICQLVARYLTGKGFVVMMAFNTDEAKEIMTRFLFDALIVDVMMPGQTGFEFTKEVRKTNNIPIILLTALGEVDDRITGLESGADDYLPKPFEPKELILRLQAVLRRLPEKKSKDLQYKIGRWLFNPELDEIHNHEDQDDTIRLTTVETNLLKALCEEAGNVMSREQLAEKCGVDTGERTIDVQVTRLRRKIEEDTKKPRLLTTVRGKGYLLRAEKYEGKTE